MPNSINLSSSIRTNLLALTNTNSLFDRTSERLSTGLRINSALDGASPFFAARNLNNRASDFTGLKDGIGQAIQTLKTADKGLEALTKLVEQAKSLADQAKEASAQVSQTTGAAGTTNATGSTSLGGAFAASLTDGASFTVKVDTGAAVTIVIGTAVSIATFIAQVEAVDSGLTVTYNSVTDKLELTAAAGTEVTITNGASADGTNLLGGTTATKTTFGSTGSGASVASLEVDYEKVLAEINQLVQDVKYKGINLLNGNNLTVNVNESSATITITGTTLNVTGLGFTAATVDFSAAGKIDLAITEAKLALAKLRTTASSFSTDLSLLQARDSFTTDLINTLEGGAGLLIDANLEQESANLLALQTRQALGTSALSFASQAQQSVLQLFR